MHQDAWLSRRSFAPALILSLLQALPIAFASDGPSAASEYIIDLWQTQDGLPQNSVTSIVQTRDGYLWLGTFGGLVRFDGVHFTVVGTTDSAELKSNRILALYEDRQGALWVGTEGGGLSRYWNGQFTSYTTGQGLSHDVVLAIREDGMGHLWIGTLYGLNQMNEGTFITYTDREGLPDNYVPGIQLGRSGNLWVVTAQGVCAVREGKIVPHRLGEKLADPSGFHGAIEDHAGNLWCYGYDFIFRASERKLTEDDPFNGLSRATVLAALECKNGDVWIGAKERGLYRMRAGKLTTLTTHEGLPIRNIRTIYEDQERNVWVGTDGGGLYRLKQKRLVVYSSAEGLANEMLTSVAEDPAGGLWVGSNGGGLYCRTSNHFERFTIEGVLGNYTAVWPLCVSRDGSLWVGTWERGLLRSKGGKTVQYTQADGLSDNVVLSLCEDRAGGLWIGTYQGGLSHFDGHRFATYTAKEGLSDKYLTAIVQAHDDSLWIGSNGGGLNHWRGGRFSVFTTKDGLPSNFIRTLYEDTNGRLWIGTGGGGLSCFVQGRFSNCTTKNGLPDDFISQILEDDMGNFWIGSNRGIFQVQGQELSAFAEGRAPWIHCIRYGCEDGLLSEECTGGFHPAGLRTRDGRLWFSTTRGLVMVDPHKIVTNPLAPPVVIECVLVDGQRIKLGEGPSKDASMSQAAIGGSSSAILKIQPRHKQIEFHFTALSFVAPEKIRFKYRLEGLDGDWLDSGGIRSARYAKLSPGVYRFQVIACNNDGIWNRTGNALQVIVFPPFWETWWFVCLSIAALAGFIYGTIRYTAVRALKQKLERLAQQHELEKERNRIAKDIHDDLGASLTQIALLSELIENDAADPQQVKGRARQVSSLASETVQSLDEIVWAVKSENDNLDRLIEYLCRLADELFENSPTRCWLKTPPETPCYVVPAEVRHNLFMAFKEALNNVLRHAAALEVRIEFTVEVAFFQINIADNGHGFEAPSLHIAGNGLKNMQARMREIDGRFDLFNQPRQGTTVQLTIPLNRGLLEPDSGRDHHYAGSKAPAPRD